MAIFCVFIYIVTLTIFLVRVKNVFSPYSITLLIWDFIFGLYLFWDNGLYRISGRFELAISIWIALFVLTSVALETYCPLFPQKDDEGRFNNRLFNCLFIITIIIAPFVIIYTIRQAMNNGISDNIFFNLRFRPDDGSVGEVGILKYISPLTMVLLYVSYNEEMKKWIRLTLLLLCLLFALMSFAKTTLFFTILPIFYILYTKGKLHIKYLLFALIFFLFIIVLVANLKSFDGTSDSTPSQILAVYLVSPMVAFDKFEMVLTTTEFGEYTFRFFYQLLSSFGFDVTAKDTVQPFVNVPYSTNVYTILYQYYLDFGYFGVAFFAVFDSLLFSIIYIKSNKNRMYRVMYAYCVPIIYEQFFNELFFQTLSSFLQVFFWTLFIYHFSKSKAFAKNKKNFYSVKSTNKYIKTYEGV